jgi:hypothetical protein
MRVDYRMGVPRPHGLPSGKVVNLDTGEQIKDCFLFDTETGEYGYFDPHPETGKPYLDPKTRQPVRRFGRASRLLFLPAGGGGGGRAAEGVTVTLEGAEILPAGRELDARVLLVVFDRVTGGVPPPPAPRFSADMGLAWQVLRAVKPPRWLFSRRRRFYDALEKVARKRLGHSVAWPDLLGHLEPADICNAAVLTAPPLDIRAGPAQE